MAAKPECAGVVDERLFKTRPKFVDLTLEAAVNDDSAAICEYGVPFSAAVERDNVAAVQFHPEKSGPAGLHVLGNWLRGC